MFRTANREAVGKEPAARRSQTNVQSRPHAEPNLLWQQLATRVQPKLSVSAPDDPYEREADQVADQVMRMSAPVVQRSCAVDAPCGQGGAEHNQPPVIHRKVEDSGQSGGLSVPDEFLLGMGSGRPLDFATRSFMEPRFGRDLSHVRVHDDSRSAASASAIHAHAFTVGRDLAFAAGQFRPQMTDGRKLLAHELTHSIQQGSETRRAGPSAIFRQVVPRPVSRSTAAQIFGVPAAPMSGMILSDFKSYTEQQADWFVEPSLSTPNRAFLWRLLLLIEKGPHILSGIGDLKIRDLRAVSMANWAPLIAFCRGTESSNHTIRLFPPLPARAERIVRGKTLLGMEAVIPAEVLEVTVSDSQMIQVQVQGLLPRLKDYWVKFEPHIEQNFSPTVGARGPEFDRVLNFLIALGAAGLAPLLPLRGATPAARWVRNLHRFPLPMLLRLVANLSDRSGAKRLILVLHTGHDPVAAFQGSANLFSNLVLNSPNNLVLMIEGAVSLAAITTRVPAITATWGEKVAGTRRISRVLIAGHGSPESVTIAGTGNPTVNRGAVSYPSQRLAAGTPDAQALLDALLKRMPPATARVLYAGCLVGAAHVAAGTPAAGIPAAVAAQQNLGAYTEARAVSAGIPAGRVQAARASVGIGAITSLFDPVTGNLSATYPFDPHAFGPAVGYVSQGREPEGVLRAAVEVGATVNPVTAELLLRARMAMAVTGDWYDALTRLLVGLALPGAVGGGVDLHLVNELANVAQIPFLALWPQFPWIDAASFRIRLNPQPFAASVYSGVAARAEYSAPVANHSQRMRIIDDEGWLALVGPARVPGLLAGILATGLFANAFEDFLDLPSINPQTAALMAVVGIPTVAQIRLGLAWFSRDPANVAVRNFLSAQVQHPPNAPAAFSPQVLVEIGNAGKSDRFILDQLGFTPVAAAGGGGGSLANLALPGAATNTLLVSGKPYPAKVIAVPHASARKGPGPLDPLIVHLVTGTRVNVMGTNGTVRVVDLGGKLAFIKQTELSPPPP